MKKALLALIIISTSFAHAQEKSTVLKSIEVGNKQKLDIADVESIIQVMQKGVSLAVNDLLETEKIKLHEAAVELEVTYTKEAGGNFAIIVAGEGKISSERTSTITYNFSTSEKKESNKLFDPKIITSTELKNIIVNSAKIYKSIKAKNVLELPVSSFDIEISFSISKSGQIGFSFEVGPFETEGGVGKTTEVVHKLKLSFI